jgi:hypothetical protein
MLTLCLPGHVHRRLYFERQGVSRYTLVRVTERNSDAHQNDPWVENPRTWFPVFHITERTVFRPRKRDRNKKRNDHGNWEEIVRHMLWEYEQGMNHAEL